MRIRSAHSSQEVTDESAAVWGLLFCRASLAKQVSRCTMMAASFRKEGVSQWGWIWYTRGRKPMVLAEEGGEWHAHRAFDLLAGNCEKEVVF